MGVQFFGNSSPLDNLLTLKLYNCNECVEILSLGLMPKLEDLEIEGMSKVKRMGSKFCLDGSNMTSSSCGDKKSIILFPALKKLTITDMEILEEWAEIEGTTIFPCLEELYVGNLPKLKTWSMSGFSSHHKLSEADIHGCPNLVTLPSMERLLSLESLSLTELGSIPSGLGSCSSLKYLGLKRCCTSSLSLNKMIFLETLEISECEGLDCLTTKKMTSLQTLEIWGCKELVCVSGLESCISLEKLNIVDCDNLISISEDVGRSSSLTFLEITGCENLRSIPEEWLGRNTRLEKLIIGHCWSELGEYPGLNSVHQLHASPKSLTPLGWDKLKSLPHQLQHLTALETLRLGNFNGLEPLPEWLGDLSFLHSLEIWDCSNLTHLPSIEAMRRLSNLQYLGIWDCPKLKKRCAKESGPEWAKISHIRYIGIKMM